MHTYIFKIQVDARVPIPDIAEMTASRAWTIDGVIRAELVPCSKDLFQLNSRQDVAVSTMTKFNRNMEECPKGVKLQLYGRGGVATYSIYDGDPFWLGWAPVPSW